MESPNLVARLCTRRVMINLEDTRKIQEKMFVVCKQCNEDVSFVHLRNISMPKILNLKQKHKRNIKEKLVGRIKKRLQRGIFESWICGRQVYCQENIEHVHNITAKTVQKEIKKCNKKTRTRQFGLMHFPSPLG